MTVLGLHDRPPPPPPGDAEWYYAAKGSREGPASASEISSLVEQGDVDGSTLVWKKGMPKWLPLQESELSNHISSPPALPDAAISNSLVWLIAFYPLIHTILFANDLTLIFASLGVPLWLGDAPAFWVVYISLSYWDSKRLERAGHDTSKFSHWVFLVPVYLFARARSTKSKTYSYFIVWILMALFSAAASA